MRLATGGVTLLDLALNDHSPACKSLLHWVASFRLVS